ncbi:ABC transporter permease [Corynebacterium guangdongense]|uniref:Spermidine/putrescine transport system permease protein n=1 Tax=Corynebacterium guangdongense TaxID=1783348 RepID=A0ABU1ZU84_9CORY|nr:ABC transporter permease subunit [Corynebacterium guangdongense]MDR7328355.1 putative spermidine/putrescine transport system permease protein [Corynebacterium guangdongense]WJZ16932.1 Spermidine/putrescine transport system permease protein PotB [Corynebacterium guangdongense]
MTVAHPAGQAEATEPKRKRLNLRSVSTGSWLGALPFFVFVALFLVLPILANLVTAFTGPRGGFSFATMAEAMDSANRDAFLLTAWLSFLTAAVGAFFGVFVAWALESARKPAWLNNLVGSFAALASQSGGVNLAYAFIALLGVQGILTQLLNRLFPGMLDGFSITGFWGVVIVYLYFQIPLMAVLMLPAMGGLKRSWLEAASSLGATRLQYVRDVVVPVLWPSIIGSFLLLFANAFAAYATAYALAGGSLNLVPILIGFYISGNVLLNPGLAAALVTWMMIIILAAMGIRFYLTRKSDRWLNN